MRFVVIAVSIALSLLTEQSSGWACDPVVYETAVVGDSTGPDCLRVTEVSESNLRQAEVLVENTCAGVALTACSGGCVCESLNLAPDDLVQVVLSEHGDGCVIDVDAPEGSGAVPVNIEYYTPPGACDGPFGCAATRRAPSTGWLASILLLGLALVRRR